MPDPLKVLVWGTAHDGACAYFRGYMYDEPLKALGVEMRHISQVKTVVKKGWRNKPLVEALRAGKVEVDLSDLEWADVAVFRRYYNTSYKCREIDCDFRTHDQQAASGHKHQIDIQDTITRDVWPAVRDAWDGAVIYETDDNHWQIKPWNGYYPDVVAERDLIADMTRRADLVTTSTRPLADWYSRYNRNIRVVKNAIDPDLYVKDTPRPEGDLPRMVYYGSTARLRDYAGRYWTGNKDDGSGYAFEAVERYKRDMTRVFLGANENTEHVVSKVFDEVIPYITSIPEFSRALANTHGDIGLAPLGGDDFDRCKSELHWLEYAVCGMAVIAQRFSGPHPYDVIRDGVDGLFAKGGQEWRDALGRLIRSKDLREEIGGRARERVLAEYDYRNRAQEWADAFRWAAEHKRGVLAAAA
jgi:glycosyltransferase involved in cell wall biosynthesis